MRWGEMREVISYMKDYPFDAVYAPEFLGVDEMGQSQWLAKYDKNRKYIPGYEGDPRGIRFIGDWYHYLHADTIGGRLMFPDAELVDTIVTSPYDACYGPVGKKRESPTVFGGFGLDFTAYGFEFSCFFNYQIGGYAYDGVYAQLMDDRLQKNWHKDMLKAWNPVTGNINNAEVPRMTSGMHRSSSYANYWSTRFYASNSALQLSNVKIGYKFPSKWTKKILLQSASIFVSADNLFVVTARKGFFPLANFNDGITEDSGSRRSQYLPLSTIMGGIKLQF